LIGLSTELPERRIRNENSTLLFWDNARENFKFVNGFNNPTLMFKKNKPDSEFHSG
jgi:hypothetical protein